MCEGGGNWLFENYFEILGWRQVTLTAGSWHHFYTCVRLRNSEGQVKSNAFHTFHCLAMCVIVYRGVM